MDMVGRARRHAYFSSRFPLYAPCKRTDHTLSHAKLSLLPFKPRQHSDRSDDGTLSLESGRR